MSDILRPLSSAFKRFLSPDLKDQVRAGIRDGELMLTKKGRFELLEILAEVPEYKEKLTAVAKEVIAEEE